MEEKLAQQQAQKRVIELEWISQDGQCLIREIYDDGTRSGLESVPGMYTDLPARQFLRMKERIEKERVGKLRRSA
ncbi:MAG: hypothetical protein HY458_02650 [Parcubacteria group bacterium]|nr:hypothetical protein [Parcubacteria group bacterium]